MSAALAWDIEDMIVYTMERYQCSRSFVIAVGMATFFDIDLEDHYARKRKR